jgi:hypothetical protein
MLRTHAAGPDPAPRVAHVLCLPAPHKAGDRPSPPRELSPALFVALPRSATGQAHHRVRGPQSIKCILGNLEKSKEGTGVKGELVPCGLIHKSYNLT